MISRLMLSLKKAADPQGGEWSFGERYANSTNLPTIQFARPRGGAANATEGGITYETRPGSQTATREEINYGRV